MPLWRQRLAGCKGAGGSPGACYTGLATMPGELYALLGAFLFGASHIAIRKAHEEGWSNQNVLLTVSIINAACYGVTYAALVQRTALPPILPLALWMFVFAGLCTSVLGRAALWLSIERIGAPRAASYRITSPIATLGLAYLVIGERLNPATLLGAAVVLLGLWLLTRETARTEEGRPPKGRSARGLAIGIALGLASSFFFGSGQVFRKIGLEATPLPLLGVLLSASIATAVFAVPLLQPATRRQLINEHRQRNGWPLLVTGLLTAAAQYSIFYSYELAPVSTASVVGATEPVWTFLASSLVMRKQEAPTWRLGLSILVVCAGTALVVARG